MDLAHAEELATTLIQHHLGASSQWKFVWDRATARFGQTTFGPRYTISLSKPLTELNTEAHVTDTILHEIAHALAGPRAGHGEDWQMVARRLGARTNRAKNGISPSARYTATHPCGEQFSRSRLNPRGSYCPKCHDAYGGFVPQAKIIWVDTRTGHLVPLDSPVPGMIG